VLRGVLRGVLLVCNYWYVCTVVEFTSSQSSTQYYIGNTHETEMKRQAPSTAHSARRTAHGTRHRHTHGMIDGRQQARHGSSMYGKLYGMQNRESGRQQKQSRSSNTARRLRPAIDSMGLYCLYVQYSM